MTTMLAPQSPSDSPAATDAGDAVDTTIEQPIETAGDADGQDASNQDRQPEPKMSPRQEQAIYQELANLRKAIERSGKAAPAEAKPAASDIKARLDAIRSSIAAQERELAPGLSKALEDMAQVVESFVGPHNDATKKLEDWSNEQEAQRAASAYWRGDFKKQWPDLPVKEAQDRYEDAFNEASQRYPEASRDYQQGVATAVWEAQNKALVAKGKAPKTPTPAPANRAPTGPKTASSPSTRRTPLAGLTPAQLRDIANGT